MPTERLSMRHIREVLRLHYSVGVSQRAVARSLGLAQGTVSKYLNRARRAGLTWPPAAGAGRRRPARQPPVSAAF
ncbi:transposase [Bradyrhizobium sp. LM6.10]